MPRNEVFCDLCGGKFFAHSLPIHRKKCMQKVVQQLQDCPYCAEKVTHLDMDAHISKCKAARAAGAKPTGQSNMLRQRLLQPNAPSPRERSLTPRSNTPRRSNTPSSSRMDQGMMPKTGTPRQSMTSAAPVNLALVPCQICGRSFNMDRIAKHQAICQKASKKRPVFRADKKRVYCEGGSGGAVIATGASLANPKRPTAKQSVPDSPGQTTWREKSNAFREAMRAAREGPPSPWLQDMRQVPNQSTQRWPTGKTAAPATPSPVKSNMTRSTNKIPVNREVPGTPTRRAGGNPGVGTTMRPKRSGSNTSFTEKNSSQPFLDMEPDFETGFASVPSQPPRSKSDTRRMEQLGSTPPRVGTGIGRPGARTPQPRTTRAATPLRPERQQSFSPPDRPQKRAGGGVGMSKAAQQHAAAWEAMEQQHRAAAFESMATPPPRSGGSGHKANPMARHDRDNRREARGPSFSGPSGLNGGGSGPSGLRHTNESSHDNPMAARRWR